MPIYIRRRSTVEDNVGNLANDLGGDVDNDLVNELDNGLQYRDNDLYQRNIYHALDRHDDLHHDLSHVHITIYITIYIKYTLYQVLAIMPCCESYHKDRTHQTPSTYGSSVHHFSSPVSKSQA